jgi:hypothetical protein
MSTPANDSTLTTQSAEAFETQFGLQGNTLEALPDPNAAPAGDLAQGEELIDAFDEIRGARDNIDLAKKREARAAARAAREQTAVKPPATAERPVEELLAELDGNDPPSEDELEGDEPGDDRGDGGDDEPDAGGDVDGERAQAILDALVERFPTLKVRFNGNGAEQEATVDDLRKKIAPGYMGQDGVKRTFDEATRLRTEAEELRRGAAETIQAVREDMTDYIREKPADFIEDWVLPIGGIDALRKFVDEAEAVLTEADSNPVLFKMARQNRALTQQMEGLKTLIEGSPRSGQPAPAAAPGKGGGAAPDSGYSALPDDFGFVAGRGYPQEYERAAEVALTIAAKAVGITVGDVVTLWTGEGRKRPVFEVLDSMVATRQADARKAELAANPPLREQPSSTGGKRPKTGFGAAGGKVAAKRGGMPSDREMLEFYGSLTKPGTGGRTARK